MPAALLALVGTWITTGHLAGARVVEVRLDQPGPHELRWAVLDREHPLFPGERVVVGVEDHQFSAVPPAPWRSPDLGAWA